MKTHINLRDEKKSTTIVIQKVAEGTIELLLSTETMPEQRLRLTLADLQQLIRERTKIEYLESLKHTLSSRFRSLPGTLAQRREYYQAYLGALVAVSDLGPAFLIFEDAETGRFVQFTGEPWGGGCADRHVVAVLDLPFVALTDAEYQSVVSRQQLRLRQRDDIESFQRAFRRDEIGKAAETIEEIFVEVYRLPLNHQVRVAEMRFHDS